LAQLKGEDPLPLRKAKISQEAILRKVEKERKLASSATTLAEISHQKAVALAKDAEQKNLEAENAAIEAEAKSAELEEQTKRVEAAVVETDERVREAIDYLESVKSKGGVARGAIWWMERELKEAQKYLPKKKQI